MRVDDKNDIKVGIFVTVGLVIFALTIIALGGKDGLLVKHNHYQVRFPQVQGLNEGSVVSLSGIKVGNILKVHYMKGDPLITLELKIGKSYGHRINQETLASIKTSGALGDKYIFLSNGSLTAPAIAPGGIIKSSSKPGLFEIISEKGHEFYQALEMIQEVKTFFGSLNQEENTTLLFKNINQSSEQMSLLFSQFNLLLKDLRGQALSKNNLRDGIQHFNSILAKIDQGEGTLGALINDKSIHQQLLKLVGNSSRKKYLTPLVRATVGTQGLSAPSQQKNNKY